MIFIISLIFLIIIVFGISTYIKLKKIQKNKKKDGTPPDDIYPLF